jgi:phage anti-repressor protein/phage antirepressor YoqD-like protein
MTNITSNPSDRKIKTYGIPTPFGHTLWIGIDNEGRRWAPLNRVAEELGMQPKALSEKLRRGAQFWGVHYFEPSSPYLPVERFSQFMRSLKYTDVPPGSLARLLYFQGDGQRIITSWHAIEATTPLFEAEPEPVPPVLERPAVTSSELIPIQKAQIQGEQVNAVSGRDLHAFLEVGKDFSAWMPESIEAFGFVEHQDFEVFSESGENSKGGRPRKEYMISISMAKELAMVQRTAKGKQARLYFIECERRALAPEASLQTFRVPTNLREALHLAAELEDKRVELAAKVEQQTATISMLEPKANGLDIIATTAEGARTLTESAKILQQPPRKFVKDLERFGWIYRTNGNNAAYQDKIRSGLMEHKFVTVQHNNGPVQNIAQPLITPKGLTKLATLFGMAS